MRRAVVHHSISRAGLSQTCDCRQCVAYVGVRRTSNRISRSLDLAVRTHGRAAAQCCSRGRTYVVQLRTVDRVHARCVQCACGDVRDLRACCTQQRHQILRRARVRYERIRHRAARADRCAQCLQLSNVRCVRVSYTCNHLVNLCANRAIAQRYASLGRAVVCHECVLCHTSRVYLQTSCSQLSQVHCVGAGRASNHLVNLCANRAATQRHASLGRAVVCHECVGCDAARVHLQASSRQLTQVHCVGCRRTCNQLVNLRANRAVTQRHASLGRAVIGHECVLNHAARVHDDPGCCQLTQVHCVGRRRTSNHLVNLCANRAIAQRYASLGRAVIGHECVLCHTGRVYLQACCRQLSQVHCVGAGRACNYLVNLCANRAATQRHASLSRAVIRHECVLSYAARVHDQASVRQLLDVHCVVVGYASCNV